jgi:DNA-binding NarL/FixJ family response regulator
MLMDAVASSTPDLCILDVRLPPTFTDEGIRAAVHLRAARPVWPCWCSANTSRSVRGRADHTQTAALATS